MIEYTLVRSNRKTLAIHITGAATVEVRAPMKLAKAEIDRFVASKREWIEGHLELRGQRLASRAAFALQYGDKLPLRGGEYPITARDGNRVGFDGERFYMPPDLPPEEIKRAAVQIYKMAAKGILTEKVIERAKEMDVMPSAVKVNSARTRWGSCSGKRSLNFSWRLIMADDEVVDYVVVHELAHIREMNHSARFWEVVESVLPDWKRRRARLRGLQTRLAEEDWD